MKATRVILVIMAVAGLVMFLGALVASEPLMAQTEPAATLAGSTPTVSATPTIDRLAAPPTVENPTQADEGAQLFWLHCQPCHGDQGQGLTDEWRAQYPPEDQDCWTSGCHGKRPYEEGFTLPDSVPAVIGHDSLERFDNMGQLFGYIQAAMPFQDPGHLSEADYLAITAFLARAHGVEHSSTLDATNVSSLRLNPLVKATPPRPEDRAPTQDAAVETNQNAPVSFLLLGAGVIMATIVVGVSVLWKRHKGS